MKYNDVHKCGLAPPQGRKKALACGWRPHFFVYQDRKLKFGTHILRTMFCTYVGQLPYELRSGPCGEPRTPHFTNLYIYQDWRLKFDRHIIRHIEKGTGWVVREEGGGNKVSGPGRGGEGIWWMGQEERGEDRVGGAKWGRDIVSRVGRFWLFVLKLISKSIKSGTWMQILSSPSYRSWFLTGTKFPALKGLILRVKSAEKRIGVQFGPN